MEQVTSFFKFRAVKVRIACMDNFLRALKVVQNTILANKGELTMSQYTELLSKIKELEEALKTKQAIVPARKASNMHNAAWEWLRNKGITDGTHPQNFLTREQFATMLKRYHDSFNKN